MKTQGLCNAWAHAAATAFERQAYYLSLGAVLPELSVQYILDCVVGDACDGGSFEEAFSYMY